MQQHLGRLDGVARVEVNLLDGKVTILPKADALFDPASAVKATFDSGVSLVEMTIIAEGHLVKDSRGELFFVVSPNQRFPVDADRFAEKAQALAQSGTTAKLRGRIYRKRAGKQKQEASVPLRFEILEVM